MAGLSTILRGPTSGSTVTSNKSGISSTGGHVVTAEGIAAEKERQKKADAAEAIQRQNAPANPNMFSNVRTAYYNNGNAMLRGGLSQMSLGGSRGTISVPNAFAQQMLSRASVNAGRWGLSELLARPQTAEQQKAMPYEDDTSLRQQIEKESGPYAKMRTYGDSTSDLSELLAQKAELEKPQVLKEEVNLNGQIMKSSALERQKALNDIQNKLKRVNEEIAWYKRRRQTGWSPDFSKLEELIKQNPTRANLPIKESVVFSS